ncbi:MAG: flagellar biosynthetic protein FliR [Phycisphaerales bacterium]
MTAIEPWLGHVIPFVLVAFRIGGLFVAAPLISSQSVAPRFRALLAIMLAAVVYPTLSSSVQTAPEVTLVELVGLIISELIIGVSIGTIAAIPLAGLQLGGYMMGHQMGLALARSFNPETNSETGAVGQLLYFLGVYVFIGIGGLDAMLIGTLNSFEHIPIGAVGLTEAPLDLFLGVLHSSYELAIRLSAPVLGVILMILIAMGVLMKTMPQINILSVGFAIKILVGLFIFSATLIAMEEAIGDEITSVLNALLQWTATPHSP